MRGSVLALLWVVLLCRVAVAADISAVTADGRAVILHDNGTWTFVQQPPPPPPSDATCQAFADYAINQQRLNLSRGCGITGAQWHLDRQRHYDYCMTTPPAERAANSRAREAALDACLARIESRVRLLGCFVDRVQRDLAGATMASASMTVQQCVQFCRSRGFAYAGVQFRTHCYCDNSYGSYGPSQGCTMTCGGDNSQICGGSWANSVYSLR